MAVVVLTGCNSGFGRAAAIAFGRRGDTVYGTARSLQRAQSLLAQARRENLNLHVKILDLTRPDLFGDFIAEVAQEAGRIDVLVNNAGVLYPGAWEDLSEADIREVMETNFFGPMLLTRAVLPQMRQQLGGCVIMISSLSGLAGLAGDVCYSASKFALEGATEALRHEVDRWGIRVALVEAGAYETNLLPSTDTLPANYPRDSPYRPLIERKLREISSRRGSLPPPDLVGELLPVIADGDGSRLRWPADDTAAQVIDKLLQLSDAQRDEYLREVGNSDWWSRMPGAVSPVDDGPGPQPK